MFETRLKVVSVVDALFNAISDSIFSLEYLPGQQVTEIELSSRFNVSRNTVREATAKLLNCGLLTKVANKGIFVKEITETDVEEIFHFRALLEAEAMRFIIRNGREIPPELYTSVENIEFDPRVQQDWYHCVSSDLNFHYELVLASNSQRLIRLYDSIRHEIMLSLCQSRNTLIVNPKNVYQHREFLDVLKTGTEEEGAELVTNHIDFGLETVAQGFRDPFVALEFNSNGPHSK